MGLSTTIMASAPVGAFLVVILGWALGSATGGFIATWLGQKPPYRHAVILGVFLTFAGILVISMIAPLTRVLVLTVQRSFALEATDGARDALRATDLDPGGTFLGKAKTATSMRAAFSRFWPSGPTSGSTTRRRTWANEPAS